jgi:hypothetical protein
MEPAGDRRIAVGALSPGRAVSPSRFNGERPVPEKRLVRGPRVEPVYLFMPFLLRVPTQVARVQLQ